MNVPLHRPEPRKGAATALGAILGTFQGELQSLGERLMASHGPEPVATMCSDLFAAGGKRLRPLATLVVGRALGLDPKQALSLAEVVELTHGATLLHDDVIDEADQRRGRPAARLRWSNALSVLGGDFLLVRALRGVAAPCSDELAAAHLATLEALVGAEVEQQQARSVLDLSVAGYLSIAAGKTGSLFAFACQGPAILAEQPEVAQALKTFGQELGVAFQIADDLRDALALDNSKDVLADLESGVLSLPLRIAASADANLHDLLQVARQRELEASELAWAARQVRASSAIGESVAIGGQHLQRGSDALAQASAVAPLTPLQQLCEWLDQRMKSARQEAR